MALDLYLHAVWGELTYQQVDGNWTQIQGQFNSLQSAFAQSIPKTNLTATTDPTVTDDRNAGYSDLSRWYNNSTETLFILLDPTPGAAVWIEDDFDPLGFGSAALADVGTAPDNVPQNSDLGSAAYLNLGTGLVESGSSMNIDIATNTNIWFGASNKIIDTAGLLSSKQTITSSGSGTFFPDLNTGINFARTITGASVIGVPPNRKQGQRGLIYMIQDGTGGHSITVVGASITVIGSLSGINTSPNAINVFEYHVRDPAGGTGGTTIWFIGASA